MLTNIPKGQSQGTEGSESGEFVSELSLYERRCTTAKCVCDYPEWEMGYLMSGIVP